MTADRRDLISALGGRFVSAPRAMDDDYLVADDSVEGFKNGVPLNVWELEDLLYGFLTPWDELNMLFSKWDDAGFGEIESERFRVAVYDPEFRATMAHLSDPQALTRLEHRVVNDRRPVTYQEFVDLVSNKRRRSFNVALHCHDHEVVSLTDDAGAMERQRLPGARAKLAYFLAEEFSPSDDPEARKYYSLQYKCWPPPLFIPSVTLLQVLFFVYYSLSAQEVPVANGPLPIDSLMIFRSDKREEIWRFLFYALVHAGWWHLIFNLTVQLLIGLPLEMVHGSGRIAFVYLSGVVAGSLAASVFDPDVYLVGGSGGVYALLAAHVANVFLNFAHIDCGLCWVVVSVFVASCDVAFAIWDRYVRVGPLDHPVSYAAHLSGATAGLTLGFLLLKSFDQRPSRQWVWWLALTVYFTLMFSAIVWNLIVV